MAGAFSRSPITPFERLDEVDEFALGLEQAGDQFIMLCLSDQLTIERDADAMLTLTRRSIRVVAETDWLRIAMVRILPSTTFGDICSDRIG